MENIDALFEQISSDILTEETKLQMAVLFENSLNEAIKAKEVEMEATNKADITAFKEGLVTNIDDYLNYFVEDFVAKNTAVIEESVKIKTAERVLKTFSGVMADFHLALDEKKITTDTKLAESTKEVSDLTKQLIEAKKATKLREKAALVMEASFALTTDVQKAKLTDYAKSLPLDEIFSKKLKAFGELMLTEAKTAEVKPVAQKMVIVEEKEVFVVEPKLMSPIDGYLDRL